jgi:hypothetical protein
VQQVVDLDGALLQRRLEEGDPLGGGLGDDFMKSILAVTYGQNLIRSDLNFLS